MKKQMEMVIPSPDIPRSSPFSSTPPTPRRFGTYFYSAPASPSRTPDYYEELEYKDGKRYDSCETCLPDKSFETTEGSDDEDFAFDVSEQMKRVSLSAEELFDGGKIRASMPPPPLLVAPEDVRSGSIESLSISHGKQIIQNVFSPRKKDLEENGRKRATNERGRERYLTSNSRNLRTARSLSPSREDSENSKPLSSNSKSTTASSSSSSSSSRSSKRWSLKALLLFRSASEGRATDRDPLRKYYGSFRKHEASKTSNFGSMDAKKSGDFGATVL